MVHRRKFIKGAAITTSVILSSATLPVVAADDQKIDTKTIDPQDTSSKIFPHGVASGDPLATQVIIWTRVTPDKGVDIIKVKWSVSDKASMEPVISAGEHTTNASVDHTIKIDVKGLAPSTTYYYQFSYNADKSVIGRTRTTPLDTEEPLEFAVISCTNYTAGFYNALERIAQRPTLNAVIHLGDYIYEGTQRDFDAKNNVPDDDYESTHFVKHKAYWLHFFRRRYSINRLDLNLQHAHQQHPFITIWDDHETANNAYKDGAKGHDPNSDGEWLDRKTAAMQVYFEWLPIRGDGSKIYRSIRFGKMMELVLLDTRLEGRDKQIYDPSDAGLYATDRTILGTAQKRWMFDTLQASPCNWRVIANQVIFSEINVKWAASLGSIASKLKAFNETFLDYWEGYPAERDEVIQFLSQQKTRNTVILSASMHCALAFDVTKRATRYSRKGEAATYDPITGKGSVAVEFASASVTSDNLDEQEGSFVAAAFQRMINKPLPIPVNYNANPHIKFVDVQRHGYFILKITKEKAEAAYYFLKEKTVRNLKEEVGGVFYTRAGSGRVRRLGESYLIG